MSSNFVVLYEGGQCTVFDWRDFKLPGLKLTIKGEMNVVKIHLPLNVQDSSVSIESNGSSFEIGTSIRLITIGVSIKNGDYQSVQIGNDFSCGGAIFISQETYSSIKIGNDCMFSTDITLMAGDGHAINPLSQDGIIKNWGGDIFLADHVWVGRSVKIARGASIPLNSIVAFGSVVTKKFEQENISIGGAPAKVISTGLQWNRKAQHVYHKDKINEYDVAGFSGTAEDLHLKIGADPDKGWVSFYLKNHSLHCDKINSEICFFEKKFNENGSDIGSLKYLEALYSRLSLEDKKIEIFEKYFSITDSPDNWALMKWACILFANGENDKAVDFAIRSIDGNYYAWLKSCSELMIRNGKSSIVLDVAIRALNNEQHDLDFIYNLIIDIFLSQNNHSQAVIFLKKFLSLRPGNLVITRKLVENLMIEGNFNEAESLCLDVLKISPRQMWAYLNISLSFERKGDIERSIAWTEKALSLQPSHTGWLKRFNHLSQIKCK